MTALAALAERSSELRSLSPKILSALLDVPARPANPLYVPPVSRDDKVVPRVFVSLRTVRPLGKRRSAARAPQDVLALGDSLKMRRVDAGPIVAQVVENKSVRDRAHEDFVSDPMSRKLALARAGYTVASTEPTNPDTTPARRVNRIGNKPFGHLRRRAGSDTGPLSHRVASIGSVIRVGSSAANAPSPAFSTIRPST